jgi:hypothetical protein
MKQTKDYELPNTTDVLSAFTLQFVYNLTKETRHE